ncbi:alanine racemase [Macrococcoides caseolyticum]|uniref:alanine racemase n=1 Tax=Macrococcoides caseolyticum TaxID=69966 RepID=UPI0024BC95AF|nr:alanine racemase [Macrococcus caseolyticus]MDJ1088428.1 alanine racemase [Macrococcus caseolyticus]
MTARWTVDRTKFIENVKSVMDNTPVMAVVKNNAYHYGLEFAIDAFLQAGITTFSTTNLNEAILIRKIAPEATIFLMNPVTRFNDLRQYNIQMTLPSLAFYHRYQSELDGISVHLEYENLLHRSGFKTFEEMKSVIDDNNQLPVHLQMNINGIWTHFGYADEFDVTEYEIEKEAWLKGLKWISRYHTFEMIHSQNSASFIRDKIFDEHTHVRIGIILYGSRPYASLDESVTHQSLTVSANVIQVRNISKGESAGYSFAFTAEKETKLAVVDIGYGDGILRTRSKHDCIIKGRRYPIRALMMSHMFVEVDNTVEAEDEVILYSDEIRIDEFTFKGIGANSEQLSALNHQSLIKEYINDINIY